MIAAILWTLGFIALVIVLAAATLWTAFVFTVDQIARVEEDFEA